MAVMATAFIMVLRSAIPTLGGIIRVAIGIGRNSIPTRTTSLSFLFGG